MKFIALVFAHGIVAGAIGAKFVDAYTAPSPKLVVIEDTSCAGPTCEAKVQIVAPGASPSTPPLAWVETVQLHASIADLLAAACVVDDGARPRGFVQKLKPCPPPASKPKETKP